MLILLGALSIKTLSAGWVIGLTVGGLVLWSELAALFWLRGLRVGADGWFHRAALLVSLVAIAVSVETATAWLTEDGLGGPPSPLTHGGFHVSLDGGIGVSCVLLVLVLAWIPIRKGQSWSLKEQPWVLVAGIIAALPAAIVGGWAWSLATAYQRFYVAYHPFPLLLAVFWVLTALLMVVEWVLC